MARARSITNALALPILGALFAFTNPDAPLAQVGGAYDLSWNTIAAGGATESAGGVYSLGGAVGQIAAGEHSGGDYTLASGFWVIGDANITSVGGPGDPIGAAPPIAFRLYPAAPNPFGGQTTIAFDLPHPAIATARIYNSSGALVRTLADGLAAAGHHRISWTGINDAGQHVAQGIYLMRLEAGAAVATRKLVLTR
ncbi:MAG: FlgD immunoglobulin-like domain containing protein [bacterium]